MTRFAITPSLNPKSRLNKPRNMRIARKAAGERGVANNFF